MSHNLLYRLQRFTIQLIPFFGPFYLYYILDRDTANPTHYLFSNKRVFKSSSIDLNF